VKVIDKSLLARFYGPQYTLHLLVTWLCYY